MVIKKIVILKTGESLKAVKEKYGDLEEIIINNAGIKKDEVVVVNCLNYEEPPKQEDIKGIIITGSNSMVSDYENWSVKISKWLENVVDTDIPILGICYGHQLLADVLGGKVGYNPKGVEVGTVDIKVTEDGKEDLLFKEMSHTFKAQADHSQSILKLPKNAKVLAYNDLESTHSFSYNNHIWGFQFHPEFSPEITKEYVKYEESNLKNKGISVEEVCDEIQDTHETNKLLKKFVSIIEKDL